MLFQSIFVKMLAFILACWLGHVTCQSVEDLQIGEAGDEVAPKKDFPIWDDAQGEWPGIQDI